MKYQVSIVTSDIEAETEEEAITKFEEMIKEGIFDWASYEVKKEENQNN